VQEPAWGLLIVIYLFCGGLSAGALMLASAAFLLGRSDRHDTIARAGALLAPFPVMLGTALLVFDLGRPFFFWKLFFAIRPFSVMWIGSWLLALFSSVSLAFAYFHLPMAWQRWRVPNADPWMRRLAVAGLPLGFAVAVYTAVLLGVLVARPLWNTPVLSVLFLLSALSTAAAALMLVVPRSVHHALSAADVSLIAVEIVVLGALLSSGLVSSSATRGAIALLAGGDQALVFWFGVVAIGLAAPLAIEIGLLRGARHSPARAALAASLVLVGGFLLRYVLVVAGQQAGLG
jgi:formate-dependent nitrite reductase membrane component NrfD